MGVVSTVVSRQAFSYNIPSLLKNNAPLILCPLAKIEYSSCRKTKGGMRKHQFKVNTCYFALNKSYQAPPASRLPPPSPNWLAKGQCSSSDFNVSSDSGFNESASSDEPIRPRRLVCAARFGAASPSGNDEMKARKKVKPEENLANKKKMQPSNKSEKTDSSCCIRGVMGEQQEEQPSEGA